MNKLLATIIISLSITNTSFAITGEGYKILDETITSAHGFKFKIEEQPSSAANWAESGTNAINANGHVNEAVTINGIHTIRIYNDTNVMRVYDYTYALSCGKYHGEYKSIIAVQPGGYFFDYRKTIGSVTESNAGDYKIVAFTTVYGDVAPSITQGNAILHISN